ncbi:MAG: hypothetical protein HY511_02060 [Actinobacteria bacterium]|nr:hypothetical protein [Actinomycetota bacterium]
MGRLVRDGGGAGRQRSVAEAHGMDGLVAWLAAETGGPESLEPPRPAPSRRLIANTI